MSLCIKPFLPKWLFGNGFVSLLPPFRKALKEIIIQNITDFQQQIGINPFAVENLVSVLPRKAELLGEPSDAAPLAGEFLLDEVADVRFFVHCVCLWWSLAQWANKMGGTIFAYPS